MNRPTALVTGAARRIGAAIATYLHQQGYRVALHCHRSLMQANALAAELNAVHPDSVYVFSMDLNAAESANKLIQQTIAWAGRLDLLVNNASVFSRDEADWELMFVTNVQAPFKLSQAAYPYLKKNHGSIINITDTHSNTPLKGYAIYCQTKAALTMQTQALALEFAPDVRVNAVAPGAIIWPEGDNQLNNDRKQQIISKTKLNRHGEPLFIAKAVFALADNLFITGQVLKVDGGR